MSVSDMQEMNPILNRDQNMMSVSQINPSNNCFSFFIIKPHLIWLFLFKNPSVTFLAIFFVFMKNKKSKVNMP